MTKRKHRKRFKNGKFRKRADKTPRVNTNARPTGRKMRSM